jgi:homospermidine synthase
LPSLPPQASNHTKSPSPTLSAGTAHSPSPTPINAHIPRTKHTSFPPDKRLLILGCGSIGQGVLPLILRHIDINPNQITILAADNAGLDTAKFLGIKYLVKPLDEFNYVSILHAQLPSAGDFLLNLSVNVSSLALVALARERGWLYLDTSIEPWEGGFQDTSLSPSARSNYAFREQALKHKGQPGPTAVVTHGANPGLVSHFVKRALLNVQEKAKGEVNVPTSREEWARLSMELGVKVIQVAERDTQVRSSHY